ncbi:PREDICTED: dnaJ homolog subfamily C member 17 [Polistes dominula]|uniref:DnaJ homolog subfamily C member 17 n=1 Tax=Polistes dominula TaxID=743375 RepID=A0ABM1HZD4_POLDO|nr:PREDICTED: dnaJ homolog subfamily C member 17 [Polistes dominula]
MDVYEKSLNILSIPSTATVEEVKKAYRKKALLCHPDKHPDNPRATELFHEISKALEILTDLSARAAYEKLLIAREQSKLRTKELSVKRQKFKEDLEAREEAYKNASNKKTTLTEEEELQAEIDRLQREGSKLLEEEITRMREEIEKQNRLSQEQTDNSSNYRIKIKWKVSNNDVNNGGYDYDSLYRILYKHGDIVALVFSKKKGRAMVEYKNKKSAQSAVEIEFGFANNPLILEGLWLKEKSANFSKETYTPKYVPNVENKMSDEDFEAYEALVLNNLRKAEAEKKRNLKT